MIMVLEWLLGYALNKVADKTFKSFQIGRFDKDISEVLEEWRISLPKEMLLASRYALFPSDLPDIALHERPAMLKLRASIQNSESLSVDEWHTALMEQWFFIQKNVDNPQPFFKCDEDIVSPQLHNLAEKLVSVCNRYPKLFSAEILHQLSSINTSVNSIGSKVDDHIDQSLSQNQALNKRIDSVDETLEQIPTKLREQFNPEINNKLDQILAIMSDTNSNDSSQRSTDSRETQIDDYAELIKTNPATSLSLLKKLKDQLNDDVSGRIHFRVEANIAACNLELGNEEIASDGFISAFEHDPSNPNAATNKALGLMLKGQIKELKAFAIGKLAEMPENEALASNFVLGIRTDKTVDDPLSLIPDISRKKPGVMWAYICWLMDRGQQHEWWDYAKSAYQQHPDSERIAEYYANSLLDKILQITGFEFGKELTNLDISDLKLCVKIYDQIWSDMRAPNKHIRSESFSLPLNLTIVYRLLNQIDDAVRVGQEALKIFPENPLVMERLAAAFLENGQKDDAKKLIQNLEVTQQTVIIQFDLLMSAQDWDGIDVLVSDHLDLFPENERNIAQVAKILADVERAPFPDRESILEGCKDSFENDARANIMLARSARFHCSNELSDHFFSVGYLALDNKHASLADRLTLANEAIARDDVGTVIKVLDGHISLNHDSEELRLLARALVHEFPIRKRATKFFQNLTPMLLELPLFQRLNGIYHFQRGVPKEAILCFLNVYNSEQNLINLIWLIRAYLSNEERDAIEKLLADTSLDQMTGNPLEVMDYCYVLLDFGYQDRAFDLGYKTLCFNENEAEIVIKFLGLILKSTSDQPINEYYTVKTGMWVRLIESNGKEYCGLIDEGAHRSWGVPIDSSNAFIKNCIGLSLNEKFIFETTFGISETWTIKEIQPDWLQAFHFLSKNFSQRFPEATDFASITMRENDMQPMLDNIKRIGEASRKHADLYLINRLPLAIVAGDRPGGAIGFADYLVDIGEQVFTCRGSLQERLQAFEIIKAHKRGGAVLDAFTAWFAAKLDIFPILEKQLGPLSLPSTDLDKIKTLLSQDDKKKTSESMSISYREGKFIRTMFSHEEMATYISSHKRLIADIEAACLVEHVVFPDNLPKVGEALLKFPSGNVIAPIVLAGNEKLFLSDDMSMRQIAKSSFNVDGVWLQAILILALEAEQLSQEDYSDAIVSLAVHKHSAISVGPANLYSVFCRDKTLELERVHALCNYIGNRYADKESHIRLVIHFINKIWENNPGDLRIYKATGMVLSALLTQYRGEEFASWAANTYINLVEPARHYFKSWCQGHFLPVSEIIAEVEILLNNSDSHSN